MKISMDYDDTLSTPRGKELFKRLKSDGNEMFIITARQDSNPIPDSVIEELGINRDHIYYTNGRDKYTKIEELGIGRHYDNNQEQIDKINQNTNARGMKFQKFGEEEDFISECIAKLVGEEGYEQEQAAAICYSKWENMSKQDKKIFKAAKYFKKLNVRK